MPVLVPRAGLSAVDAVLPELGGSSTLS